MTVVPFYGRDYKSAKAAEADFNDNKFFIIQDISSNWDGKTATKSDLKGDGYTYVNIRYDKLRKIKVVKIA